MDQMMLERIVTALEKTANAFESIAKSLVNIDEDVRRVVKHYVPEPRKYREAIVTRIPTEEDRAKEAQGASSEPIPDWLSLREEEQEEEIGWREREIIDRKRRAEAAEETGPGSGGIKAVEYRSRGSSERAADNPDVPERGRRTEKGS